MVSDMDNTKKYSFDFAILKGMIHKSTVKELKDFKELVKQSPDSELRFDKKTVISLVNEELRERKER